MLFLFLSKFKFLAGMKIAVLFAFASSAIVAFLTGPLGWIVSVFLVLVFLAILWESILSVNETIFRKLGSLLISLRNFCNQLRKRFPLLFPVIFLIELAIVAGLAAKGIWSSMDWADKKPILTQQLLIARLVIIIPFVLLLYRGYLKDTTPPNTGGDGPDGIIGDGPLQIIPGS